VVPRPGTMFDVHETRGRSPIPGIRLGLALTLRRVLRGSGLARVSLGTGLAIDALVLLGGGRGGVLVGHARQLAKPAPSAL